MNSFGSLRTPFLFIIDYAFEKAVILTKEELDPYKFKFSFNKFSNTEDKRIKKTLKIQKEPPASYDYLIAFDKVQKEINAGNTYLLNLSFETPINFKGNLKDIYHQSKMAK